MAKVQCVQMTCRQYIVICSQHSCNVDSLHELHRSQVTLSYGQKMELVAHICTCSQDVGRCSYNVDHLYALHRSYTHIHMYNISKILVSDSGHAVQHIHVQLSCRYCVVIMQSWCRHLPLITGQSYGLHIVIFHIITSILGNILSFLDHFGYVAGESSLNFSKSLSGCQTNTQLGLFLILHSFHPLLPAL